VNQIPVLDVFILSLLDRGAESAYDLHRQSGISLGASTPSLVRLTRQKLVVRRRSPLAGKRIRYAFRLTTAGVRTARAAWSEMLGDESRVYDLDSTLRIVDMAAHYGSPKEVLRSFLERAATERFRLVDEASTQDLITKTEISYTTLKTRCDAIRLRSEAEFLLRTGDALKRRKDPVDRQRRLH
jgi:DNA-binding PadR family transcriptional regulator